MECGRPFRGSPTCAKRRKKQDIKIEAQADRIKSLEEVNTNYQNDKFYLQQQIDGLTKEFKDYKIDQDRITKKRDEDHHIALVKQQHEFEIQVRTQADGFEKQLKTIR